MNPYWRQRQCVHWRTLWRNAVCYLCRLGDIQNLRTILLPVILLKGTFLQQQSASGGLNPWPSRLLSHIPAAASRVSPSLTWLPSWWRSWWRRRWKPSRSAAAWTSPSCGETQCARHTAAKKKKEKKKTKTCCSVCHVCLSHGVT